MKLALILAAVCFVFISVSCENVEDNVANEEDNTGSSAVGAGRRGDVVNMEDLDEQLIVNIDSRDVLGFDTADGDNQGAGGEGGGGKRGGGSESSKGKNGKDSKGNKGWDDDYGDGRHTKGVSKGGKGAYHGRGSGEGGGGNREGAGRGSGEGGRGGAGGGGSGGKLAPAGELDCDEINRQCHCNQINRQGPRSNGPDDYPDEYTDGVVKGVKG